GGGGDAALHFNIPDLGNHVVKINSYSWKRYELKFTTHAWSGDTDIHFHWVAINDDAGTVFYLDGVQLEEAPEVTEYYGFNYEYGCCPEDFCWTGGNCIDQDWYENYVLFPPIGPLGTDMMGKNGYRCIGGDWKYQEAKNDPRYRVKGYCPRDDQCFGYPGNALEVGDSVNSILGQMLSPVNGEGLGELFAKLDLQNISYQLLVWDIRKLVRLANASEWCHDDNTYKFFKEYDESFYCYNGNWTTRTKAIALQLHNFTDTDDYTLSCDKASKVLDASEETEGHYRSFGFEDEDQPDISKSFFLGQHEAVEGLPGGQGEIFDNYFNEFCVLRLKDKVIAGTSLNFINLTTPLSGGPGASQRTVLQMIRGPTAYYQEDVNYCQTVLEKDDGQFYPCCGTDVEVDDCTDSDVWYNPGLNSVIFTMIRDVEPGDADMHLVEQLQSSGFITTFIQGTIDVLKSVLDSVLNVLGFGRTRLSEIKELDFIKNAGDFDKLYMSRFGEGTKTIYALKETRYHKPEKEQPGKFKTAIAAEYKNYQADVCRLILERAEVFSSLSNIVLEVLDQEQAPTGVGRLGSFLCTLEALNENEWKYDLYLEGKERDEPEFSDIDFLTGDAQDYFEGDFWNDITSKIRTRDIPAVIPSTRDPPRLAKTSEDGAHYEAIVNQELTFKLENPPSKEDVLAVTWDFGDRKSTNYIEPKSLSSEMEGTVFYEEPGTYPLDAYVIYDDYTIKKANPPGTITVYPEIEPQIGVLRIDTNEIYVEVELDDQRTNTPNYNYYLYFGDVEDQVEPKSTCGSGNDEYCGCDTADDYCRIRYKYSGSDMGAHNGVFDIRVVVTIEGMLVPLETTRTVSIIPMTVSSVPG
ncbi:hypothetical protein ACFL96_15460, partial [Thermoproteota archaeon]